MNVQVPFTTAHSSEGSEGAVSLEVQGSKRTREDWYCCSGVQRSWLQEFQDLGRGKMLLNYRVHVLPQFTMVVTTATSTGCP